MHVGCWHQSDRPCYSFADVAHSNGTLEQLIKWTGCPPLRGDKFTLSERIRAVGLSAARVRPHYMDILCWGSDDNKSGQRARELSFRDTALEYGQWDGHRWSAVRSEEGLIVDDRWHHVCVTLNDRHVVLYLDGEVVAQGALENTLGAGDVGRRACAEYCEPNNERRTISSRHAR